MKWVNQNEDSKKIPSQKKSEVLRSILMKILIIIISSNYYYFANFYWILTTQGNYWKHIWC